MFHRWICQKICSCPVPHKPGWRLKPDWIGETCCFRSSGDQDMVSLTFLIIQLLAECSCRSFGKWSLVLFVCYQPPQVTLSNENALSSDVPAGASELLVRLQSTTTVEVFSCVIIDSTADNQTFDNQTFTVAYRYFQFMRLLLGKVRDGSANKAT